MKLYFTHIRENDDENNTTMAILSDVPFNQIQNTSSFMAYYAELDTDDIMPYIWVFLTGQRLLEIISSLDISKYTILQKQEMNVENINVFYQYKATLANGKIYNLLLSNPDGNLSRPNDYIIVNGMFHGKVGDIPAEEAGMFDGATIVRIKDIEGSPEVDPLGISYDKLILAESNEESNVSNTASLKVKDKNGNWVDISGVSIRTHNLNKATTLYRYTTGDNYIYTSIHNLILGIDISNSIVTGKDGAIFKPTNTPYSVVKARYDENQNNYVTDPEGDVIAIHDSNGNIYVRDDSSGDVTIN